MKAYHLNKGRLWETYAAFFHQFMLEGRSPPQSIMLDPSDWHELIGNIGLHPAMNMPTSVELAFDHGPVWFTRGR